MNLKPIALPFLRVKFKGRTVAFQALYKGPIPFTRSRAFTSRKAHDADCQFLTIAGSDSGGGAGIQAEIKVFSALRTYGTSIITALTAQNTQGVTAIPIPPHEFIRTQLDAVCSDMCIDAVKIGMLANAEAIHSMGNALRHWRPLMWYLIP